MKPVRKLLGLLSAALLLTMLVPNAIAEVGPIIPKAIKGKQCVEDTSEMRRNHMDYLKKHRVEALRHGVRTKQYSLKECLECHVPAKGTEASAENGQFCKNCHVFVGVKLDCFDCHATQPEPLDGKAAKLHPFATPAMKALGGIDQPHSAIVMNRLATEKREAE
ncbi:MAG: hypothetical protein OQK25_02975 [Gammaproteobacteria bacterium]|nr:hypothetical protein [Gammaproteobacteria bacterium]MCW8982429.1 hypothetical protein [Gammaproteobacteria bacterium]